MKIKDEAFAKRLEQAADAHPHCPALHQGRQVWLADEMKRRGQAVSKQAVMKWFEGDCIPRAEKRNVLAEVLGVDVAWLMWGTDAIGPKERKIRNAVADAAVNVLAGLVQMDGGNPAFPEEKDRRAAKEFIDLYAVIKGANYSIHVTLGEWSDVGEQVSFSVPAVGENVIVIGMVRKGFVFEVFEITPEVLDEHGTRRGGETTLTVSPVVLHRVTGFDQRL